MGFFLATFHGYISGKNFFFHSNSIYLSLIWIAWNPLQHTISHWIMQAFPGPRYEWLSFLKIVGVLRSRYRWLNLPYYIDNASLFLVNWSIFIGFVLDFVCRIQATCCSQTIPIRLRYSLLLEMEIIETNREGGIIFWCGCAKFCFLFLWVLVVDCMCDQSYHRYSDIQMLNKSSRFTFFSFFSTILLLSLSGQLLFPAYCF